MSLHTAKAIRVARSKGAAAALPQNHHLWKLSKREILEVALHLSALATGAYDPPSSETTKRCEEELEALRDTGIV